MGLDYDWMFRIKSHDPTKPGGYTRDLVLRQHIKAVLNELVPALGASFSGCHRGQLRNAIAHSQYYFLGRDFTLSNYVKSNPDHIRRLNFEQWSDIFHETLVIFTLYRKLGDRIRDYYYDKSLPLRRKMEIRVNWQLRPDPYTSYEVLYTRDFFKDWSPYPGG